jgi:hypothetical protein
LKHVNRRNPRLRQQKKKEKKSFHHPPTNHQSDEEAANQSKYQDEKDDSPPHFSKKAKTTDEERKKKENVETNSYVEFNFETLSFTPFLSSKTQKELNSSSNGSYIFLGDDFFSCVKYKNVSSFILTQLI